jgi:hypothetical protein
VCTLRNGLPLTDLHVLASHMRTRMSLCMVYVPSLYRQVQVHHVHGPGVQDSEPGEAPDEEISEADEDTSASDDSEGPPGLQQSEESDADAGTEDSQIPDLVNPVRSRAAHHVLQPTGLPSTQ